jgi:aryl-alcohol dehydrogenase-like predicted oxidoreductase
MELAPMQTRPLGRTGQHSSVVALGGIVVMNEEQEHANHIVQTALDYGVNHFDVAPTYGDAEIKLGEALRGKRKNIFLACKTAKRTRVEAEKEMQASFERLQTDYFDLYQMHGLDDPKEMETALGEDGAIKAILAAREQGKIRHIGMTGHKPSTFMEALKRFPLETCMLPIDFVLHMNSDYGKALIDELVRREIGIIAIKPIAAAPWKDGEEHRWNKCWYRPLQDEHDIELAVRWVLQLPVTTIIPSGHSELFFRALKAARHPEALNAEETAKLKGMAEGLTPLFKA